MNLTIKLLLILYGLLFIIGDTASTQYALAHGAKEINPFVVSILPCWWCILILKTCIFAVFVMVVRKVRQKVALYTMISLNLILAFVVLNNFYHFYQYPIWLVLP